MEIRIDHMFKIPNNFLQRIFGIRNDNGGEPDMESGKDISNGPSIISLVPPNNASHIDLFGRMVMIIPSNLVCLIFSKVV